MNITWGDDLLETTKGLDILGVRGIDQAVELALVNGITTISQRARYFSILPWALGEYLVEHASERFDWNSLMIFLRRVEFMTLAASRLDSEVNGADAGGALGANLHHERLATLIDGGTVTFPDDKGGAMLGTYFAPCRTVGLLLDGDVTVPYRLSPRGKEIWELRRERIRSSTMIRAISNGNHISRTLAEEAIPEFSLGSLALSFNEAKLLYGALVTDWDPGNEIERSRVARAYEAFNGTIEWATEMLAVEPDSASGLIVRNLKNCTQQGCGAQIAYSWAEYEYRRRCHFALELMLSALTRSLVEFEEAAIAQVVSGWFDTFEASPLLNEIWPEATSATESNALEAVKSVPKQLFFGEPVPINDFRHLPTVDQALVAVALLAATAGQTKGIRRDGYFDRKSASPGERALSVIEAAGEESFSELMVELLNLIAHSHLQTTLRKMGAGQKCSLRFSLTAHFFGRPALVCHPVTAMIVSRMSSGYSLTLVSLSCRMGILRQ